MLGGAAERWRASDGPRFSADQPRTLAARRENNFSPKAALSWHGAEIPC